MYNRKLVFWSACLGMLLFGIGLITLGSIIPDLKEKFGVDNQDAGELFSILPIGILGGSLLFGPVCDRYGYKALLILACLGLSAGFESIAFSSSIAVLKVSIFVFGFCAGIINGATNAVVSDISSGAKGASLSLLGAFFGIGALGMPFLLGILKKHFDSFSVVSGVGFLPLAVAVFYGFVQMPSSKKALGFPLTKTKTIFADPYLFFLAFYLFFEGSLESVVNNWTTTYLVSSGGFTESRALFALSLYVAGLTGMRLLTGTVLSKVSSPRLIIGTLSLAAAGFLVISFTTTFVAMAAGLVLVGAGLSAGFPVMLGLAGHRFASLSATAFSFMFTVSLTGNMLINFFMGRITGRWGIGQYKTITFIELACVMVMTALVFRSPQNKTPSANQNE